MKKAYKGVIFDFSWCQSQEFRPAADWGLLQPERAPLLQWLQQAVQRRGVPLRQQLSGDEWAASWTEQPWWWAAFARSRTVQPCGAGGRLEQGVWSWKLGLQRWTFHPKARSQGFSSVSRSNVTNVSFSLDTISEEHTNIWGTWHTTLKPILKDQQFTGKQFPVGKVASRKERNLKDT